MNQRITMRNEPMDDLFGDSTTGRVPILRYKTETPIPPQSLSYIEQTIYEEVGLAEGRIMQRIDLLEQRIIKSTIESDGSYADSEDVILLKSMSREQAKKEIMELLDKFDKLYYSDIAETLRLDLEQVVEVVEELEAEGKVGEAE